MGNKILNKNQLNRMPLYLEMLKKYKKDGLFFVNCQTLADDLGLNQEQVKKDIAAVSTTSGIPNKGRDIYLLIRDLEQVLGYDDIHNAVLIGVGSLGKALLKYDGFKEFSLKIVGAFDNDEAKTNQIINNVRVNNINDFSKVFKNLNAKIGIICVDKEHAQSVCDLLVNNGVQAIWNFVPIKLNCDENVIVSNTNMAANLAVLSHQLFLKKKEMKAKLEENRIKGGSFNEV